MFHDIQKQGEIREITEEEISREIRKVLEELKVILEQARCIRYPSNVTKDELIGKKTALNDKNQEFLPADKGRIMVAMDKWEKDGGEESYESKMREQVLVDLKAKPCTRAGKDWDLMGKVSRDGERIITRIVERNEMTEETAK